MLTSETIKRAVYLTSPDDSVRSDSMRWLRLGAFFQMCARWRYYILIEGYFHMVVIDDVVSLPRTIPGYGHAIKYRYNDLHPEGFPT